MTGALVRSQVERGSLEEIRRNPRSYAARQLREWRRHWYDVVSAASDRPEECAYRFLDRLMVLRYLFDHDILKRSGWRLKNRFAKLVSRAFEPNGRGSGCSPTLSRV